MRTVFISAILINALIASMQAHARAPKTLNEQNLIYWRYLCENQPQVEKSVDPFLGPIELKCPGQGWSVKAIADQVQEVNDHAR
jgi:hypothetical protein